MASAELRVIRRRIKSVESTKKITRAMELIAASRIVKARARVKAAKPYAEKMAEVVRNVGKASSDGAHPLLERRDSDSVGVLIITSDRGLAGGYNSNVIRMAETRILELVAANKTVRIYAVGSKAQSYFSFRKYHIEKVFLGVTDTPGYGDARAIANALMDEYASGAVDAVEVFNTAYFSGMSQVAEGDHLLPISTPSDEGDSGSSASYEYEPEPAEILGRLLPRYVESSIFGKLLDSSASEHAARQRAMKAASDNADELIKVLTRTANQARQAEITTEISEIVGGAEALSSS
jgi:F-type H+-transporting ATPase subunit gamma